MRVKCHVATCRGFYSHDLWHMSCCPHHDLQHAHLNAFRITTWLGFHLVHRTSKVILAESMPTLTLLGDSYCLFLFNGNALWLRNRNQSFFDSFIGHMLQWGNSSESPQTCTFTSENRILSGKLWSFDCSLIMMLLILMDFAPFQGTGLAKSMFVQSLRGDPFRVSFPASYNY